MAQSGGQLSGILEEMTIEQVRELKPEVVVLAIGSTEPHGPHLPYGTDTCQADAECRAAVIEANKSGGRVLMYPTLPIGNNVNFKGFPFACRIGVRTLMQVVLDVVEALEEDGIRKIVLVNGHGGNTDALTAAIREHVGRRKPGEAAFVCMVGACGFVPREIAALIEHPSDHAGEAETSLMLHLRPDLVHAETFAAFPFHKPVLAALASGTVFCVRPWHGYVPAAAGGDTRASSAAKGKAMFEAGAAGLARFLVELSREPWHDLFPLPPRGSTRNPAQPD